jgi:deoxyribodipyrimidine photo-lyase
MNIRDEALNQLEQFCQNNLGLYGTERNFDYGPSKRTNTSNLSKYITHRIISEHEVIQSAYKKFSFKKIEKFIQEVLWRTYWKGWLEMRPQVWQDYIKDISELETETKKTAYQNAVNGKTSISCFNDWIFELKKYGYLHNHTRMWFASIWIFTLNLPWQLGTDFFLKHLLDGDPASNTLSWRWVAGLHTKGKHYLATDWNINKFSSKKYENLHLNEKAHSKTENPNYIVNSITYDDIKQKKSLFLFHNLESSLWSTTSVNRDYIYGLIDFNTILKNHNYSNQVLEFKDRINKDLREKIKNKFNSDIYIQTTQELETIIKEKNIEQVIFPYITIGHENDFIKKLKKDFSIVYQINDYDKYCWQFSTKGYFAFKEQIPKILTKFL